MWNSNAPHTNSGYAVETRDVLFRLIEDGWKCACVGFFGNEGYKTYEYARDLIDDKRFEDLRIKVYPKMVDFYGTDAMVAHGKEFGADVCFTMQDVWTLNLDHLKELKCWIPYIPIDQEPVFSQILQRLNLAYKIITFSRFGQKTLQKHGYASTLILEGIDCNIFKPLKDKEELRKKANIPVDAFVFGMIAANKENPPRKGYQEILESFKLFSDNHPEARLYIHSQQLSPSSFPVAVYAHYLGVDNKVMMPNQYYATFNASTEDIVKEINTFDVCMHASQTEGFGLGIIESQACGVPPIVNRCHSMPELVIEGETGEICETGYKWYRNQQGFVYMADVKSLHEKMEILYKKLKEDKDGKIAKACRNHILKNYEIDDIVKLHWIPFLEQLQEELLGKPK